MRTFGRIAESLAQFRDSGVYAALEFDKRFLRPQYRIQRFAADDFLRGVQQSAKDAERLVLTLDHDTPRLRNSIASRSSSKTPNRYVPPA
jgi:hypothetical protein